MTGGAEVECVECPPGETLDLILERAIQRYNPMARVVTLGARGYGEDQEYLALHEFLSSAHADLVVSWATIAETVPANTFRSGQPRPGVFVLKPTFALRGNDIVGPTEEIGKPVYRSKLSGVIWPLFINPARNWNTLLPKADPGASIAPRGVARRLRVDDLLEEQQSSWSIWISPRPARVQYGINLTRALLRHMRELATLRGARFAVLLTPKPPEGHHDVPVALEHAGYWFLGDPAARDAAIAEATTGLDPITLPSDGSAQSGLEAERLLMEHLADALNERNLLTPVAAARPRH